MAPSQPPMAAAMMMLSPRITEPIKMASAVLWSSSISLRSEKGVTILMMAKLAANMTMPKSEYRTDATNALKNGAQSIIVSLPSRPPTASDS